MDLNTSHITNFTAILGACTGVAGFGLSLYNTYTASRRDKVRLQVIPKVYVESSAGFLVSDTGEKCNLKTSPLCVEVRNLGSCACTVSEIGVFLQDGQKLTLIRPIIPDGTKLPRRMEPKESFTAFGNPAVIASHLPGKMESGYARTACGNLFKGKSTVLAKLADLS